MRLVWGAGVVVLGLTSGACYQQPSVDDADTDAATGTGGSTAAVDDGDDGGPATQPMDDGDDGDDDGDDGDDDGPTDDGIDESDGTGATTDDDDGGSSGEPIECEAEDGETDPRCPEGAPFCAGGTCVGCDDVRASACFGVSPTTPICDDSGACVACSEHEQCPTGACRIATGECFPAANRLWVDNTAADCANGTGTEAAPMCNVLDALDVISDQPGTQPWAVFVAGSPNPYVGRIRPLDNRPLAILGPDAGLTARLTNTGVDTIDMNSSVPELYLSRLQIENTGTGGTPQTVRCSASGEAWIYDTVITEGTTAVATGGCVFRFLRSAVDGNDYNIVVGQFGSLYMDESAVMNASGAITLQGYAMLRQTIVSAHYVDGGIEVLGGELHCENCMIHGNTYEVDGILLTDGGTLDLVYTTLVGGVQCMAEGKASIRNSIVVGPMCASVDIDHSAVENGGDQGEGNVGLQTTLLDAYFVDPAGFGGDYHLADADEFEGVAVHAAGDPVEDYDGDARPEGDDEPDWPGADVP